MVDTAGRLHTDERLIEELKKVVRVVALRRGVSLPVRFLGTGEGLDDLESFDARAYARRLVHE